jgi:diguanylate cyclase (GGDEF)-like protein
MVPDGPDDDDDDKTMIGVAAADVGELSKDRAYLIVIAGTQVGEMIPVSGASVVGRGVEADIRLLEAKMSRRHCRVVVDATETYIEDLGSANGTYVNGLRIDRQKLNDGDKIQVGETTILKFTYHDRLEETFQKQMYDSALRDGLTRIYNKRYFQDRIRTEVAFTSRHRTKLSLILFDLDHFKQINDTHGHLAGDKILAGLAAHVQRLLRAEDVFARWGGEEFAVLCRDTDLAKAELIAERIRASIEKLRFVFNGEAVHITISLGVAMVPDPRITDEDGFIAATDTALYEAKRGGRNRVVCRPVA